VGFAKRSVAGNAAIPPYGKRFQRNRQDETGRTCTIFAHGGAELHTGRKKRTGIPCLGDFFVCAGLPQAVDREVALPPLFVWRHRSKHPIGARKKQGWHRICTVLRVENTV